MAVVRPAAAAVEILSAGATLRVEAARVTTSPVMPTWPTSVWKPSAASKTGCSSS